MNTLDRYLFREVGQYLLAVLAAVVLALLGGALFEVLAPLLQRGADPLAVAQFLAFRVPEALARGLPLAFLFAMLMVLSRMGEESELKALLAIGVSKTRVLMPLLLLGAVIFLLALFAGESLVPDGIQRANSVLRQAVFQKPRALIQPGMVFSDAFGRMLYVGQVSESEISQVRILNPQELLIAERGRFEGGALVLQSGVRITLGNSRPRTVARFERATVPLVELGYEPTGSMGALSMAELSKRIREFRSNGIPYHAEATQLERRWAEPAAVFAFALFAVGLAFFLLATSRSLGMVGVAVLTFVYYATWSVCKIMGEQGVLAPFLAAWGPNFLFGLAGIVLLRTGRG